MIEAYGRLPRAVRVCLWAVLAAWILAGAIWVAGRGDGDGSARRRAEAGEQRPRLLLMSMRASGDAQPALALVHDGPSGASVMSIPAETVVEVPGRGPGTFTQALVEGGTEELATALANVLGIRVPPALVGDGAEVGRLIDTIGPVEVEVPADVEGFAAGPRRMDAGAAVRFLGLEISGETGLERVARQDALVRGVIAAAAKTRAEALTSALEAFAGDADPASAAALLGGMAGRRGPSFHSLPVHRSQVPRVTRYEVTADELGSVRKALEDVRTVKGTDGRRVRLLAPDSKVAARAAAVAIENGYVIVLSGRTPEARDETRIVMAERTPELEKSARRLRKLMGVGTVAVYSESQTVFDVTLELGRDWRLETE